MPGCTKIKFAGASNQNPQVGLEVFPISINLGVLCCINLAKLEQCFPAFSSCMILGCSWLQKGDLCKVWKAEGKQQLRLKTAEVRGGKTAGVGGYLVLFPATSQLSFLAASSTDQQQPPFITKCLAVSSEVLIIAT